jgi:type VI secretion system protein ImpC
MSDFTIDITAGRERDSAQPIDEQPFRIALLGDWSGRGSRGEVQSAAKIAARQPHQVDRDDLDQVLEDLAPALALQLAGGSALSIRFGSLEDFHPDQLYARLPIFQALRDLRKRLADPKQFPAAAREMSGEAPPPPPPPPAGVGLLDAILDESSPADSNEALANSGGDLHTFLQQVLKPHLVPRADPRQADLIAQVDAAAGDTLRAILHHPTFQSLEALWRGADLLVRRIDTSSDLRVELIDLSEAELRAALPPGGDPQASPLSQLLTRQSQSAPWGLLAGAFTLGGHDADAIELLAQLAAIGHIHGAPWIGGADPEFVTGAAPGWEALRGSPLAQSLGLVLPRFILRLPYGRTFDPCDALAFEEVTPDSPLSDYLWAPPAFAVALVLGRAFAEAGGWQLSGSIDPDIGSLAHVVHGRGADAVAIPCGEALMTVQVGNNLMERGFMPLASLKDQDRVRLLRLQSAADPLKALAGRWS